MDNSETRVSLLLRLQDSQDHQAWSDFVDIYSPILYGFGRRHGLQDADAADLVQEVLLSLSKSIRHYDRQRGPFRRWLMAVVRNRLSDHWQRRSRQAAGSGDTGVRKHLEQVPSGSQSKTCGIDVSIYSPPPCSYACRSNGLSRYGLRRISQSTRQHPK